MTKCFFVGTGAMLFAFGNAWLMFHLVELVRLHEIKQLIMFFKMICLYLICGPLVLSLSILYLIVFGSTIGVDSDASFCCLTVLFNVLCIAKHVLMLLYCYNGWCSVGCWLCYMKRQNMVGCVACISFVACNENMHQRSYKLCNQRCCC
jgi:hypothetical protein